MESDLIFILEQTIKAASIYNSQPWLFRLTGNTISIIPDFSKKLDIADPAADYLYLSLGCALENLVISARHTGYNPLVKYHEENPLEPITIEFEKSFPEPQVLFQVIDTRQTTRCMYNGITIYEKDLEKMLKAIIYPGSNCRLFMGNDEIELLKPYINEALTGVYSNARFLNELSSWIRFSEKSHKLTRDGMGTKELGMISLSDRIGKFVFKRFTSPRTERERWDKLLQGAAGIALFMVEENGFVNFVNAGRNFQRFALTCALLKIRYDHIDFPCMVKTTSEKITADFGLNPKKSVMLLRLGYAGLMPASLRKPLEYKCIK